MKYNKSIIMNRAWDMVKTDGISLSAALRLAWVEAKTAKYSYEMTADRRQAITEVLSDISTAIINGTADIHDFHKAQILRAALTTEVVSGMVNLWGKAVGLCKWACKQKGVC